MNENDDFFMRKAIELAKKGIGKVNPNPLVGAVIVKESQILAEGYHKKYGDLHAERDAFQNFFNTKCEESGEKNKNSEGKLKEKSRQELKDELKGATLYVTLTPCCHFGKQPPCTDAIIENKIARVVIGSRDPNPLVGEKSIKILENAGIEVKRDCLKSECDSLNEVFFKFIQNKTPYVVMKYAMTADGKIATKTNESKWISGEKSIEFVHFLRNKYMGIMVGINTVLLDNPMLNCRLKFEPEKTNEDEEAKEVNNPKKYDVRQPVRIICDSKLRIPMDSNIVKTANKYQTIIATAFTEVPDGEIVDSYKVLPDIIADKIKQLQKKSVVIINACARESKVEMIDDETKEKDTRKKDTREKDTRKYEKKVDLVKLMRFLGKMKIDGILLEGGATLNENALKSNIVDEVFCIVAPKIFGGKAKSPVDGDGISKIKDAYKMSVKDVKLLNNDVVIRYKVASEE
ncbi:bifunctional diaminohydroxyphosphoribosylaminopyrimidine deaminase/5-amino-6-(5-phosphoribosylamino)uracil reductase RibD [Lachnobacterium bovis]|uniref:bifunctional diaminohydroxyphosphoribosylaminopyrimidine deaminase/5-amino-6-(5-phosphoribosylamino)uracil reductase RibD n=1 Tax=Lachnobacterium bovis TaxID=140626 RepID=UPI0003B64BE1|nr:bifunctional diaminohydroxyphosphoribosylaminopyrimidine deaminase/5-amino-6-(5-phosphoribosylamino)uracil reductase RibD [Lachnobacterium bovis]